VPHTGKGIIFKVSDGVKAEPAGGLQHGSSKSTKSKLLNSIASRVISMKCSILKRLIRFGTDANTAPAANFTTGYTPKDVSQTRTLLTHSRHLWALADFAEHEQGRYKQVAVLADYQYNSLVSGFTDPVDACFYAAVANDGSRVIAADKVFQDQTVAISGLAKYGRQYGNTAALQAAARAFQAWDGAVHDSVHGGYVDAYIPANSSVQQLAASREALRNAKTKSLDSQLRVLAMLIDLARAEPLNPVYSSRLQEMVGLLTKSLVVPAAAGKAPTALLGGRSSTSLAGVGIKGNVGPYVAMSATNDLSMLVEGAVSYGLTAEYVWYVDAALQLLLSQQRITPADVAQMELVVVAIGRAAAKAGIDLQYGGTYSQGMVNDAVSTKAEKFAWVQIEAAMMCMKLYRLTGELGYLALGSKALEFLQNFLWDSATGEVMVASSREGKLLNPEVQCGAAGGVEMIALQHSACDKTPQYTAMWHASRGLVQLSSWLLDEGVQGLPSCNE
jgi:hypothetical protein